MPTTEPITARLKNDNWDLHQIAERGGTPSSMIKGTISRDEFAAATAQAALVHRALDAALSRVLESHSDLRAVVLENEQAFTPWYSDDLAYFGVDIGSVESSPGTARYIAHIEAHQDRPLHILGLHYVRFGATNGNRFVARQLRKVFAIESETDGMRALDPYGDDQRSIWTSFKERLDNLELTDAQRDELFAGTRAAYVLTINLDLAEPMSDTDLLEAHGKTLDRDAFERGHSVHVSA